MIKVQKIFFCDNIEESQFNKKNFLGVILGKEIEIYDFPYKFFSVIGSLSPTVR
jgi:hypothetical protein